MSQAEALASHWVLLFFLGLLNKYMLVWSTDYASVERSYTRQDFVQRTWSQWTDWSACSRTCGGGVKMRTRVCRISKGYSFTTFPNECIGETVEYELCSVHNCSPYDKEFLEYQCSLRDGQIIRGTKVDEWIPYRYGKNTCELQCWSKDRTLVHSFGKVIDGTKCATPDPRQPALCINGRCTPVDCAGQIGSDNKLDRCGVCRGNNSTCIHYKNTFWRRPRLRTPFDDSKDHHYDYEKITTIPAGATEIIITEDSETNFLALLDHKGTYLVNGNWRIQSPGRVVIHGSEFTYNRTWDGREWLLAQGPTRYEVHVYVLGSGDIPTVNYEYWISSTSPFKPVQPFPVLNQIKHTDTRESKFPESKYSYPENNHIHDESSKKHFTPVTQFQGYKSYYHRNEILKSVPSWSIKRHRTHKNINRYVDAQNDISSSTVKNSVELYTRVTPYAQVAPSPGSQNKTDAKSEPLDKLKHVHRNNKTRSLQTNTRIYSAANQQETLLHEKDYTRRNATVKPFNGHKRYGIRQRYNANTITPIQKPKLENYEQTTVVYGWVTTALNQKRDNNNYYHREALATLQPQLYLKEPESNVKHKSGTRRQKSLQNDKLDDENQKRSRKRKKPGKEECQPCPKPKKQKKSFCTNNFVLRGIVLSVEKQEDSFRYELQISQSYKNKVPISPREYVWTTNLCRCPKLHTGNEYVIMGHTGTSSNRRESRLLVDKHSFVRKFSSKRDRTMQRLVRDQSRICKKYE